MHSRLCRVLPTSSASQLCRCLGEAMHNSQDGSTRGALVLQDAAGRVDALQEAPAQPLTRNVAALPPAQVKGLLLCTLPALASLPYISTPPTLQLLTIIAGAARALGAG